MRKEESTPTINAVDDKVWRNKEGNWHRIGGPAVEWKHGVKHWYQNGVKLNAIVRSMRKDLFKYLQQA